MSGVLVDSSVLLDLFTEDPQWFAWSSQALQGAADDHPLWINPLIYAEISVRFERIEELEAILGAVDIRRGALPYEAAFLAGKCYLHYRKRGGRKTAPLPDFFIGAHASVNGWTLLTRDATRFRTYFPRLALIAPPTAR